MVASLDHAGCLDQLNLPGVFPADPGEVLAQRLSCGELQLDRLSALGCVGSVKPMISATMCGSASGIS